METTCIYPALVVHPAARSSRLRKSILLSIVPDPDPIKLKICTIKKKKKKDFVRSTETIYLCVVVFSE